MNRRVENRIILSVWLLVLAAVVLIVIQFRSVHVASVERVREDSGAVVFVVGVNNPTANKVIACLLYTSPSPRDQRGSRMPSSA